MSSFLDALKAAPQTPQAKLNIFLLSFQPQGQAISIFLEGRDDPSLIRVNVQRFAEQKALSVETIILGNKKEVLKAYDYLGKRFPNNPRIMFFVDKDHDDLLGENRGIQTQESLFVTPYYSIENYLVSESAIAAILTDFWGLDSSSEAITIACQKFHQFQADYRQAFLPWMAWLLAIRRLGENPNNNNINASVFTVDINYQIMFNWQPDILTHLGRVCNVNIRPDSMTIDHTTRELEALPTKVWLRGKQELWCLVKFLNRLEEEVKTGEVKLKIRSPINLNNIVELLAPRLPCPSDLDDYLVNRLSSL
ncbi:DUF4435 domain-containing protein [Spirulina subsalsa]|uniref:DUF4435 domain-containing protein n=1 Tax=Spirulina subsalsa TaxID=54311 RepID=UPI0002F52DB0|nr:DUF4435 domain-containing protein [Spirulina subsalsa]